MKCKIEFIQSDYPPIEAEKDSLLVDILNTENSTILFGCRTGLCGTCLIELINSDSDNLSTKTDEEKDFLEEMYPENKNFRLACQVSLKGDIKIKNRGNNE